MIARLIRCFVIYCSLCIKIRLPGGGARVQSDYPLFQGVAGTLLVLPREYTDSPGASMTNAFPAPKGSFVWGVFWEEKHLRNANMPLENT